MKKTGKMNKEFGHRNQKKRTVGREEEARRREARRREEEGRVVKGVGARWSLDH